MSQAERQREAQAAEARLGFLKVRLGLFSCCTAERGDAEMTGPVACSVCRPPSEDIWCMQNPSKQLVKVVLNVAKMWAFLNLKSPKLVGLLLVVALHVN